MIPIIHLTTWLYLVVKGSTFAVLDIYKEWVAIPHHQHGICFGQEQEAGLSCWCAPWVISSVLDRCSSYPQGHLQGDIKYVNSGFAECRIYGFCNNSICCIVLHNVWSRVEAFFMFDLDLDFPIFHHISLTTIYAFG